MFFSALHKLKQFMQDYPEMRLVPNSEQGIRLRGLFRFKAKPDGMEELGDAYKLEIFVPYTFPRDILTVQEIGGRIPKNDEYHINQNGTLCLGSPYRLLVLAQKSSTFIDFINVTLIPYLYSVSHKLNGSTGFVFGELAHGVAGIKEDYALLLGLTNSEQVNLAIRLLTMKKRVANKMPCPCGCGKRLGRCRFNLKIAELRKMASRKWFKHYSYQP